MSESEGDKSYLSMLNNAFINPSVTPASHTTTTTSSSTSQLKPCVFHKVQEAESLLLAAAQDKYLTSESDEALEWINTVNELGRLPMNEKELVQLGLLEKERGESIKTKSVDAFFKEQHGLEDVLHAFQQIQGESQVYLIGEGSITVLILCSVKDTQSSKTALVGLRSLLVQT